MHFKLFNKRIKSKAHFFLIKAFDMDLTVLKCLQLPKLNLKVIMT